MYHILYIPTHVCKRTHARMHVRRTYIRCISCVRRMHARTYMYAGIPTNIHTYIHICIHTYIYIYIDIYLYIFILNVFDDCKNYFEIIY